MTQSVSVYIRIMLAHQHERGMRLSSTDVQTLAKDWAIYRSAHCLAQREGRCEECYRKRCKCEDRQQ